jgi:hypothetical protein
MKAFLESVFPGTVKAIDNNQCPLCQAEITSFRDAESEREYEISGMCQSCQDKTFREPNA